MGDNTIKFFSKILIMIILKATILTGVMGYEYYWKDYDFVHIPNDALEIGKGSNTYIGQAYIYDKGLFVGTLHPGQQDMAVSAYGYNLATDNIKILCTNVSENPPDNMWLKTSKADYHSDIIGQYPINGGWSSVNHAHINIGRVTHGSYLVVGNLDSFSNEVYLYYAYNGEEFQVPSYQVLVNP